MSIHYLYRRSHKISLVHNNNSLLNLVTAPSSWMWKTSDGNMIEEDEFIKIVRTVAGDAHEMLFIQ